MLKLETRSGKEDEDGGRSIGDDERRKSSSPSVSVLAPSVDASERAMRGSSITGIDAARATTRWKLDEAGRGGNNTSAGGTCCCWRHAAW